jgi:hypothetical protein
MRPIAISCVAISLLVGLGAAGPAEAARTPRLRLGRLRVVSAGVVAVPVELVARRSEPVAALNFNLTYDPAALTLDADNITAGPALVSTGAELAARADTAAGRLRVLVLPAFRPDIAALRGRRVATVHVRTGRSQGLARWVRRHLRLERVVLADAQGHELSSAPAQGER